MYSDPKSCGGTINILPPHLAQKIAAGEVIERPQSVVRELLDNAIDSGSNNIDLILEEGGNSRIIIQDNGCGMGRENLSRSWLAHATSKIAIESDLYNIRTLGFRGEALSSIATVSQLTITSSTGSDGGVLEVHGGDLIRLDPFQGKTGTRVEVRNLFYNLPARKQFLKRSATETAMCKTTFIDKALAHPAITFRLFNETGMQLFLPACPTDAGFMERFRAIYPTVVQQSKFLHELNVSFPDGGIKLLVCRPELFQHDRKLIQVFVNRRRINEYSLVQAIEYGYTGFLPGGRFPIAVCFLDINPERVDVNIHPAKREVKIRDIQTIHAQIVRSLQNFLRTSVHQNHISSPKEIQYDLPTPVFSHEPYRELVSPIPSTPYSPTTMNQSTFNLETRFAANSVAETNGVAATVARPGFRYLGLVFGVFLVVIIDEQLMLMDMHAAHERILFDRFRQDGKRQELLVPIEFKTEDSTADLALTEMQIALQSLGIHIEKLSQNQWKLIAIPACFAAKVGVITEILEAPGLYQENLERTLFATLACRTAIKDGDIIGYDQATQLIAEALNLPEQRCPHGRPIFFSLTKTELFQLVGRKV